MNASPLAATSRRRFLRRTGLALAIIPFYASRPAQGAAAPAGKPLEASITDFGARTQRGVLNTAAIQAAIDAVHQAGGGTVRVPPGRFRTGSLLWKSNVHLRLEEGAILQGSEDWKDYRAFSDWSGGRKQWGDGEWSNALLTALEATNLRLEGPGTIDGADCTRPGGEEGFRGPHAVVLRHCRDVQIRDLTIRRAGNYAFMFFDTQNASLTKVKVRGGHDGLHTQRCEQFRVHDCDFRTGDDCFAGCDNVNFEVLRCLINSSCNGFRLGCDQLVVKDCRFWGPGEYEHKISGRTNMLGAFVHFAPHDRQPQRPSDRWHIENLSIDQAEALYLYDFERGGWMQGQPAKRLLFKNIQATNLFRPTRLAGDAQRQLQLTLENVSLALRKENLNQTVLEVSQFDTVTLRDVRLVNSGTRPALVASRGNHLRMERLTVEPENPQPYRVEAVAKVD